MKQKKMSKGPSIVVIFIFHIFNDNLQVRAFVISETTKNSASDMSESVICQGQGGKLH